jgi:hypothetical protein
VDWTDPAWIAGAHAWIRDAAKRRGIRIEGDIEQPHIRAWSTVMRVPARHGDVWFKANVPLMAYEADVVAILADTDSDRVPPPLATEPGRGWLLMQDAGRRLRDIIEEERDLGRWLDIMPLYAQLQLRAAAAGDRLLAAGVPDRRLATLAAQYEQLLARLDWLPADQLSLLLDQAPRVAAMCDELAGFGIPETIQHDDLHDGQVFVSDDRYLFMDWGDACLSHPFFTMSVTLEGVLG